MYPSNRFLIKKLTLILNQGVFILFFSLCLNLAIICYHLALIITLRVLIKSIIIIKDVQKQLFFLLRLNNKSCHKLLAYQSSKLWTEQSLCLKN